MEAIKKQVKDLMSNGKVEKAIKVLLALSPEESGHLADEFVKLSRRLKKVKRGEIMNKLTTQEADKERSNIDDTLLMLLEELGEPAPDTATGTPVDDPEPASTQQKTKILFLGSNPSETGRLQLGKEIREIKEALKLSKFREQFELVQSWAVRPADLRRAMLDENPQIVHFSGHGVTLTPGKQAEETIEGTRNLFYEPEKADMSKYDGGIVIEDDQGKMKILPAETLAGLFKLFEGSIRCVLLNACYSQSQSSALKPYVPYIIGMNQAVPDDAAILFATGFYDALGAGKDIPEAFDHGKVAVDMEGKSGADIMVLDTP